MIKKKCWPLEFEEVLGGKKNYELRLADFVVHVGDTLLLKEWDPKIKDYTGRTVEKKVTFIDTLDLKNIPYWSQEDIKKYGLLLMSLE